MKITEIEAKSILRKSKRVDSWFLTAYGMNFYRGCLHNCTYCDGRSENYYVEGEFGKEVTVKKNAIDILNRELNPARKRVPLKKCFMLLGGGVTDSYQPIESKYQFSREALKLFLKYNLPVHILTKSTLVERDLDLIKEISSNTEAVVSFSLSSVDDGISKLFEPGGPSASERLRAIKKFKSEGLWCGVFLMPVLPFLTDTEKMLDETVRKVKEAGADFIIFGGLTLKPGIQKEYFMEKLKKWHPSMEHYYKVLFRFNDQWGNGVKQYYIDINRRFYKIAQKYSIPVRMPHHIYQNVLDANSFVAIMLEHIDYIKRMRGEKPEFGSLAHKIATMKEPVSENIRNLYNYREMNHKTEKIIKEILETKSCEYYIKVINS